MPVIGRGAVVVAVTCVGTLLGVFPNGEQDRPRFKLRLKGVANEEGDAKTGDDGATARKGTEGRRWRWARKQSMLELENERSEVKETLWTQLRRIGRRKARKLEGIEAIQKGDVVKEVTNLAMAITGTRNSDTLTRHYHQMFEADGVALPVKGSAHLEEFDMELDGVRESAIIAEATTVGEDEVLELLEEGILEALKVLRERIPKDSSDQYEIARALANLATVEEGRTALEDSGWRPILVEMSATSSPFGGRLQSEAKRALANLTERGTRVYPDGLSILSMPDELLVEAPPARSSVPDIDIVFLHGLRGGSLLTWRTTVDVDPTRSDILIWPRDWLGKDLPSARILSVEYDGRITNWTGKSLPLEEQTSRAVRLLTQAGVGERPVVFVAHSYGGIITKEIVTSTDTDRPNADRGQSEQAPAQVGASQMPAGSIGESFRGAVFYGTPHRGSPLAENAKRVIIEPTFRPSKAVSELTPGAQRLEELDQKFKKFVTERSKSLPLAVVSFGEGVSTAVAAVGKRKLRNYIVPPESADAGVGRFHLLEDVNHISVCKPPSTDDIRYTELLWMVEDVIRRERSREDSDESD